MWYVWIYVFIYMYIYTNIHTHNGILVIKKEWNAATCEDMDGSRGYYAKWNKSDRKTTTVWFHLYVESKKNKCTNVTEQKQSTDTENKQVVARGERCEGSKEIAEGY